MTVTMHLHGAARASLARTRFISGSSTGMVLALTVLCGLAALRSHFQLTLVVGGSMQPTFHTGDLLVVDKHAYKGVEPSRGDIVVVRHAHEFWVKRIVGLPGEEVEVSDGMLVINGHRMVEGHALLPGPMEIAKGRLFSGKFAVLGDNRTVSPKKGMHAIVTKDDILGKVLFRIGLPHGSERQEPDLRTLPDDLGPAMATRDSILTVARMGRFSSDRAIREYCEQIWQVQPLTMEPHKPKQHRAHVTASRGLLHLAGR